MVAGRPVLIILPRQGESASLAVNMIIVFTAAAHLKTCSGERPSACRRRPGDWSCERSGRGGNLAACEDDATPTGPCYHEFLSPVLEVVGVSVVPSGAAVDTLLVSAVRINGQPVSLAELTSGPSFSEGATPVEIQPSENRGNKTPARPRPGALQRTGIVRDPQDNLQ
jgi:hypothetical protein